MSAHAVVGRYRLWIFRLRCDVNLPLAGTSIHGLPQRSRQRGRSPLHRGPPVVLDIAESPGTSSTPRRFMYDTIRFRSADLRSKIPAEHTDLRP